MSDELRVLVTQMIMRGFRGLRPTSTAPVFADVRDGIGSVVLFDIDGPSDGKCERNIDSPSQVAALCSDLANASPRPALLIGIDMEGGRVCRLRQQYGFPATRSAQDLGANGDPQQTYDAAVGIADTLAAAGINFNLAPCVDVDVNPNNPVIGSKQRSYAADPEAVAEHAAAFIGAHRDRGIATCLKHFPGHGSSDADSHVGFTDVTRTWSRHELLPYRRLIEQGLVDAIMTAHVVNHQFDTRPATLSKPVIDDLLRDELGFEGVVISDDMGMGAIAKQYGFSDAVIRAINAGVDMLALANQADYDEQIVERTIDTIIQAVNDGNLDPARLRTAARRISQLQQQLVRTDNVCQETR